MSLACCSSVDDGIRSTSHSAPPSEDTIRRWASELGEDPDVLLALAGKVSSDLQAIFCKRPRLFADLLRQLKAVPDQAVLRIPDDDQEYPLPAGLGQFPLAHVDGYTNVPARWTAHGGVFMPMWPTEATWIRFLGAYAMAIQIAAGKSNAVTGEIWTNELSVTPQNYMVVPEQPWLDGFCISEGLIWQFVATPLGEGFTVEEQLTGSAEHGGLQIIPCPMRRERFDELQRERTEPHVEENVVRYCLSGQAEEMGMTTGGLMRQEIYADPYGINAWDIRRCALAASCIWPTRWSMKR